jgi:hypothetical protein
MWEPPPPSKKKQFKNHPQNHSLDLSIYIKNRSIIWWPVLTREALYENKPSTVPLKVAHTAQYVLKV